MHKYIKNYLEQETNYEYLNNLLHLFTDEEVDLIDVNDFGDCFTNECSCEYIANKLINVRLNAYLTENLENFELYKYHLYDLIEFDESEETGFVLEYDTEELLEMIEQLYKKKLRKDLYTEIVKEVSSINKLVQEFIEQHSDLPKKIF